ncbi:unnamed protein product, partial [Rotaria sp. Silwood1]
MSQNPSPSNVYNPLSTSQPSIRPMYHSPSSAYRPQVSQQSSQFILSTTNQTAHPPLPSRPPPSTLSSTYPYPQYN